MSSQCISRALLEWWDTLQELRVTCVICTVMHSKEITKGSGNGIFLFVSNLMCLFLIMQQFIPSTCHSIPQLELKAITQFPFRTSRTTTSWSPKKQAGTAKPAHYPSVHSLTSEPLDVEEPALLPLKARGAKWHLRGKGAVPGNYWQKSTEDGYSTSGNKVLPKKLRET